MSAQQDIKKLIQDAQRYEFADGLRELQMALMMAAIGLVYWFIFDGMQFWIPLMLALAARLGIIGRWSIMMVVLLPALLALVALLIIRYVRQRWLWRGIGYVKPKRQAVPLHVSVISVTILLVGLGLGILLQAVMPANEMFLLRMLLVASGWSFGYTLIDMGHRLNLPRYTRVGLWASAITSPLLFLPLSVGWTGLLWGLVWGTTLSVSGLDSLRGAAQKANEANRE